MRIEMHHPLFVSVDREVSDDSNIWMMAGNWDDRTRSDQIDGDGFGLKQDRKAG